MLAFTLCLAQESGAALAVRWPDIWGSFSDLNPNSESPPMEANVFPVEIVLPTVSKVLMYVGMRREAKILSVLLVWVVASARLFAQEGFLSWKMALIKTELRLLLLLWVMRVLKLQNKRFGNFGY